MRETIRVTKTEFKLFRNYCTTSTLDLSVDIILSGENDVCKFIPTIRDRELSKTLKFEEILRSISFI